MDYKLGEQWTLSLAGTALDSKIKVVKLRIMTAALLLDYAFNSALTNSWILEGGVFYGGRTAEGEKLRAAKCSRARSPTAERACLAGYQWYWGPLQSVGRTWVRDYNSQGDKNVEDSRAALKSKRYRSMKWHLSSEGAIGLAF